MKYNKDNFNFWLFVIALWCYNIIKARQVPFYWDEIYTYLNYVKPGVIFLQTFNKMDANHHLLNTWLIQIAIKTFGKHEFIIRLPNVISFLLFAFYAIKLTDFFKSVIMKWGVVLILLLNPFVNDYFCLARGYGISMAMIIASLYYAIMYFSHISSHKNAFCSLLFASLGLLANFSLLNFYLVLVILYGLSLVFQIYNKRINYWSFILVLLPFAILSFAIPLLLKLKNANALFVGKNNGFWHDTVSSLIQRFLYQPVDFNNITFAIKIGLIIVLILGLVLILKHMQQSTITENNTPLVLIFLILVACIFANLLQNYYLHVLFGIGRTAMYYYPLFSLFFLFTIEKLRIYKKSFANFILSTITVLFFTNFVVNMDTHYAFEWKEEGDSKLVVNDLIRLYKNKQVQNTGITIGMGFPYHDDLLFYKEIYELPWLNFVQDEYVYHVLNDYYFIPKNDTIKINNIKYKIIASYQASSSFLIENQQLWHNQIVYNEKINFDSDTSHVGDVFINNTTCIKIDSTNQFSKGIKVLVTDSFILHPLKMQLDVEFFSKKLDDNAKLVFSIERNGQSYLWKSWSFKQYIMHSHQWNLLQCATLFPNDLQIGDIINCYVWNTSKQAVYVKNLNLQILSYIKRNPTVN